jgi:histidinol-phosphate phosphatase family protein
MTTKYPLEPIYDRDISKLNHFLKGVIVFDRDGTLVEDAGQHNDPRRLKLRSGVFEGVTLLKRIGFGIAVASNQAGLETKKFTLADLTSFNQNLKMKLKIDDADGIDLIVICPHHESSNCDCRKPRNGLLEAIRLSGLGEPILFIGDTESDRIAADSSRIKFLNVDSSHVLEKIEDWIWTNGIS